MTSCRYLNEDGTVRPTAELVAVIMEYEHALGHVTDPHDGPVCPDCQWVVQGALDGVGEADFLEIAQEDYDV